VGLPVPADVFDLERLDAVIRHGGDPIEFPESPSLPAAPRTEADAATALVPRR
jgi:hypothetical protein